MTNDLFRDHLEGKIRVRTREELRREALWRLTQSAGSSITVMAGALTRIIAAVELTAAQVTMLSRALRIPEQPPHDPRARALWAKQQRGTGPEKDTLRNRGRINHYRTKG